MKKTVVILLVLCMLLFAMLPNMLAMEGSGVFRGNGYYAPYAVDDVIDVSTALAPKTADALPLASLSLLLLGSCAAMFFTRKH